MQQTVCQGTVQISPHASENVTVEQFLEAECHRLIQRVQVLLVIVCLFGELQSYVFWSPAGLTNLLLLLRYREDTNSMPISYKRSGRLSIKNSFTTFWSADQT
jgi:hypothetical protein